MNIVDTSIPPINIFLRSSEYTTAIINKIFKSNLLFELNKPIVSYPNIDIFIKLESFQFTNALYTINDNNRNFYYSFYLTSYTQFSAPLGNYDIDSLILYLNSSLPSFIFTYYVSTYKITITNSTPFSLFNGSSNIYEILGFEDTGTTSLSTAITSPYLFNLISVQVLHVCINDINLNSYGLNNKQKYNILGSIHLTAPQGETQTFTTGFMYNVGYEPKTSLIITILDQDFNIVNFNNIDWFCNIGFHFIYKKQFIASEYLDTQEGDTSYG